MDLLIRFEVGEATAIGHQIATNSRVLNNEHELRNNPLLDSTTYVTRFHKSLCSTLNKNKYQS